MTDAPERIWMVKQDDDDYGPMPLMRTTKEMPEAVEYIRNDIYRAALMDAISADCDALDMYERLQSLAKENTDLKARLEKFND